jgi:hypothetical protein
MIYQVELIITGDVVIAEPMNFHADKELRLRETFRSDVKIHFADEGFKLTCTVGTQTSERAHQVALLFIGKMLDVMSVKVNLPLFVSSANSPYKIVRAVKGVLNQHDFKSSFIAARKINNEHPTFLRALNWYRKGLYTEDPFDKFLAFWNSISVVGTKYYNPSDRTTGSINQIWDCFSQLWGTNSSKWKLTNGNPKWINEHQELRNHIAHGVIPIEPENVDDVLSKITNVKEVAYQFLVEFGEAKFKYNII